MYCTFKWIFVASYIEAQCFSFPDSSAKLRGNCLFCGTTVAALAFEMLFQCTSSYSGSEFPPTCAAGADGAQRQDLQR